MDPEPFTTTVKILERHKIRLPQEVHSRIPLLSKSDKTVTAVAIPGHFGGIQIVFGELPLAEARARIGSLARSGKITAADAQKDWTLLSRYFSNAWNLTFSFYDDRYTVVLPSVARDIGILPKNEGESVVIFLCGEIFELWRTDEWDTLRDSVKLRLGSLEEDLPASN
jgi:hypothetical protein